jgi:hypothetical protein
VLVLGLDCASAVLTMIRRQSIKSIGFMSVEFTK